MTNLRELSEQEKDDNTLDELEGQCECWRGILWPWGTDSNFDHQWIERCDECAIYESDDDAAEALAKRLGNIDYHYGWVASLARHAPYIDVKEGAEHVAVP